MKPKFDVVLDIALEEGVRLFNIVNNPQKLPHKDILRITKNEN